MHGRDGATGASGGKQRREQGSEAFGSQRERVYNAPHETGRRGATQPQLCRAAMRRGGGEAGGRGEAMYAIPDVEEVVAVAKNLGVHLGPAEAVLDQKDLLGKL